MGNDQVICARCKTPTERKRSVIVCADCHALAENSHRFKLTIEPDTIGDERAHCNRETGRECVACFHYRRLDLSFARWACLPCAEYMRGARLNFERISRPHLAGDEPAARIPR